MKKFIIAWLVFCVTIFLASCNKEEQTEQPEQTEMKELIFLEKTTEFMEQSFVFESSIDKKYYIVEVSNWEYNNTKLQHGEVVELESKKVKDITSFDSFIFNSFVGYAYAPKEEVFFLDKWNYLFVLNEYPISK